MASPAPLVALDYLKPSAVVAAYLRPSVRDRTRSGSCISRHTAPHPAFCMYSTSLVVLVVAVLTYEMMQDYDVGGTAIIGAISTALAMPTDSNLDWSALVRRRTRLRPSSDHLVGTYMSCRLLASDPPTDSPSFPCIRSRSPPEHACIGVVSLILHFGPRSRCLLQLSLFAGSSKSRSHLRPRTSRRTIAIARAVDTPRCIQIDEHIPRSSR